MIKFPDRQMIVEKVLSILNSNYTADDLRNANITWWKNIRSTGGYGLTYAGSQAFEKAQIEFQEFDNGHSGYVSNMGLSMQLDRKMVAPYYFYSDKKHQKIRIYDSRVAMMIVLCDSDVNAYLESLSHVGTLRKR